MKRELLNQLCMNGTTGYNQRLHDVLVREYTLVDMAANIIAEGWGADHLNAEMVAAALLGEAHDHECDIRRCATEGKLCDTPPEVPKQFREVAFAILVAEGHLKSYQVPETNISPVQ